MPMPAQIDARHPSGLPWGTHMFNSLYSWENLYLAYRLAAKGKRGRATAASFEYRLEDNLMTLQEELRDGHYQPGAYHSFFIHEPKRRLISAAPFRDRVVHHALCNLIEPVFERSFIADSYANRVGKGTHRAVNRCQHFSRRYRYVLQLDLAQFFPSIDHDILRSELWRKVRDPQVRWLSNQIIKSGIGVLNEAYTMQWFPGDDLFAIDRPRGLPIGNLTSQFWANCYLNPFDHFVTRGLGCRAYTRFVDDMLLFADDKATLWGWHAHILDYLARLRLTIHPHAHPQPVTEGIPFLGFVVYPEQRRLKGRKVVHFRRTWAQRLRAYAGGEIPLASVTASVRGWLNHAYYANTSALAARTLGQIRVPSPLRASF